MEAKEFGQNVMELPGVEVVLEDETGLELSPLMLLERAASQGIVAPGNHSREISISHKGSEISATSPTFKLWGWTEAETTVSQAVMAACVMGYHIHTNIDIDAVFNEDGVERYSLGKLWFPAGTYPNGDPRLRAVAVPWGPAASVQFALAVCRVLATPPPARQPEWFLK